MKKKTPAAKAEAKTSGEGNADIVIGVIRRPVVDVHTIRVEVANVDEVAVRCTALLFVLLYPWQEQAAESRVAV